jgi:hypothetical protein
MYWQRKMKKTTKEILFERMKYLNEDFRPKEPIGGGKDHYIYDYEGNSDKVIKVAWGREGDNPYDMDAKEVQTDLNPNHVATFNKFPNFFAKVYKFNNKYAIIEKLNTDKIKQDEIFLYNQIKKYDNVRFEHISDHGTLSQIYWVIANDKEGFLDDLISQMTNNNEDLTILNKYIAFYNGVLSTIKGNLPSEDSSVGLDVGSHNLGYDTNNNIKLLDF